MEKNKANHENNRETMDALQKEFEIQIGELLTDKQKAELEAFMKNRRPPKRMKEKSFHK